MDLLRAIFPYEVTWSIPAPPKGWLLDGKYIFRGSINHLNWVVLVVYTCFVSPVSVAIYTSTSIFSTKRLCATWMRIMTTGPLAGLRIAWAAWYGISYDKTRDRCSA